MHMHVTHAQCGAVQSSAVQCSANAAVHAAVNTVAYTAAHAAAYAAMHTRVYTAAYAAAYAGVHADAYTRGHFFRAAYLLWRRDEPYHALSLESWLGECEYCLLQYTRSRGA